MTISYDQLVDAMYIRLREGETVARNVRLDDQVALDLNAAGATIGMEILNASKAMAAGQVPEIRLVDDAKQLVRVV